MDGDSKGDIGQIQGFHFSVESQKMHARTDVCGPRVLEAIFTVAKEWERPMSAGGQLCKQRVLCANTSGKINSYLMQNR